MRLALAVVLLVPFTAGVAHADRLTQPVKLPATMSLSYRLKDKVNLFSDEVGLGLRNLSFNVIDLDFDLHTKKGKVNVGAESENFGLRIRSDVRFQSGYARVDATLDLKLAGRAFKLEMPDFDLVPRSVNGERVVEVRVPVLYGHF